MATAFENLAPRVMRELISDFELTVEQAAGIVGNLGAESGLLAIQERSPTVRGSRGGFGWAQWTGPRRVSFENWVRMRGLDLTGYAANYGYLRAELAGTVQGFDYRKTITQLKKTTTVKAAAETFEYYYERAGIKNMGSRLGLADRAMRLYETAPLPSSPSEDRPMDRPMPSPSIPLPDQNGKPWWASKTVIGGIMAIALPLLSAAFPALKLVDPNSATDFVLRIIQVIGPVLGGALAIFGRVQATQPIGSGRPLAQPSQPAYDPVPSSQAPYQTSADPGLPGGIMGMSLEAIVAELPTLIDAIGQLNRMAGALGAREVITPSNDTPGTASPLRQNAA